MHLYSPMKAVMTAAILIFTPLAMTSVTEAGGFVSLGMGSAPNLGGEVSQLYTGDESGSNGGRIAMGERLGPLALEAGINSASLLTQGVGAGAESAKAVSLEVSLKYYFSFMGPVEAYAKGGLAKTWIVQGSGMSMDSEQSGRAYALGGGLQYSLPTPILEAGVWMDYSRQILDLHNNEGESVDGSVDVLTMGVSFGF